MCLTVLGLRVPQDKADREERHISGQPSACVRREGAAEGGTAFCRGREGSGEDSLGVRVLHFSDMSQKVQQESVGVEWPRDEEKIKICQDKEVH